MRAGVIVNASAGKFDTLIEKIPKLEKLFDKIFTGYGRFGGDFLKKATVLDVNGRTFKENIKHLTSKFCKFCDVIVSIGGDGTANIIAETIIDEKAKIPIMGIAGGTANVGPLVRFSFENLKNLKCNFDIADLKVEKINALKVCKKDDGRKIGYAFIDVVFGNTFLGTIDGKSVNLSAEEFLKSERKVPITPREDITSHLKIIRNGERLNQNIKKVAQIVVSPLNFSRFYIGKAVTGALCLAPFVKAVGVVALLNTVVINSSISAEKMKDTIVVQHILFNEYEKITLEGFKQGVYIILDGNPICASDFPVVIEGLRNAIDVIAPPCEEPYPIDVKG